MTIVVNTTALVMWLGEGTRGLRQPQAQPKRHVDVRVENPGPACEECGAPIDLVDGYCRPCASYDRYIDRKIDEYREGDL